MNDADEVQTFPDDSSPNRVHATRELSVDIPTQRSGNTEEILEELSRCRVDVESCLEYGAADSRKVLLIADDPDKAVSTLLAYGYRCRVENVVIVQVTEGNPGTPARIGQTLERAGIRVLRTYISIAPSGTTNVVLHTDDNELAEQVLAAPA